LSDAGKPIWTSTEQSESVIAPLMGVVTAVLGFVSMNKDSLRAVITGSTTTVVIVRGAIVLLASSSMGDSEAFLAFILETLYHQVLFSLTSLVQRKLKQASGFDMRNLLGGTEPVMAGIANNAFNDPGLMTCSLKSLEIDISVRNEASRVLTWAQSQVPEIFYGILLVGDRILTVLQPKASAHRIHDLDLKLIINFVNTQKAFHGTESWTPLCLPRFNANGYLNGYIGFLDEESDLCLIFISSQQKLETFLVFQEFSAAVSTSLQNDGSIQKIRDAKNNINEQRFITGSMSQTENTSNGFSELSKQNMPLHFIYVHKPPVGKVKGDAPPDPSFSQYLCPNEFPHPLCSDKVSIAKYWTSYQSSILRLRHATDSPEVTLSTPNITAKDIEYPIASKAWLQTPIHDLSSFTIGNILMLGFTGENFELHAIFHSNVVPSDALNASIRLVENIKQYAPSLFLLKPPIY